MTALEETIAELARLQKLAANGSDADKIRFANMALGCWRTIEYALTELQRQRIV